MIWPFNYFQKVVIEKGVKKLVGLLTRHILGAIITALGATQLPAFVELSNYLLAGQDTFIAAAVTAGGLVAVLIWSAAEKIKR